MHHSNLEHFLNCKNPQLVRNAYTGELITVPCGVCSCCRSRKILKNVSLLQREASCWKYVIFFTLTYNDICLPKVDLSNYKPEKKYENEFKDLCDRSHEYIEFCKGMLPVCSTDDVQRFFKRLRENIFRKYGLREAFRYFLSFDYGSTTFRPHYHGLFFTSYPEIGDNIESLLSEAWTIQSPISQKRVSMGIVDCQHAYAAAKYVSVYIQNIIDLPVIYQFRNFRTRSIHSCHPSLGSLVAPLESPEQIIHDGLSEITLYDTDKYVWRKYPLSVSLISRYFPTIPYFSQLSKVERFEIYRLMCLCFDLSRKDRLNYLKFVIKINSFFRDYVQNFKRVYLHDLDLKLDRLYYVVLRLYKQCQITGHSLSDYDDFISQFHFKRYQNALKKQFLFEKSHSYLKHLDSIIDPARNGNLRFVNSFMSHPIVETGSLPSSEIDYFHTCDQLANDLVKRKLNNKYLELHPEYKKFHS